jgi:hypothetical protein
MGAVGSTNWRKDWAPTELVAVLGEADWTGKDISIVAIDEPDPVNPPLAETIWLTVTGPVYCVPSTDIPTATFRVELVIFWSAMIAEPWRSTPGCPFVVICATTID